MVHFDKVVYKSTMANTDPKLNYIAEQEEVKRVSKLQKVKLQKFESDVPIFMDKHGDHLKRLMLWIQRF